MKEAELLFKHLLLFLLDLKVLRYLPQPSLLGYRYGAMNGDYKD